MEATPEGYASLLAWATQLAPGPRLVVGGGRLPLPRRRTAAGAGGRRPEVVEAGRPQRASRRPGGKSDPADARLAARTVLGAKHHARPRRDGDREALRILLVAREHATTTRTAAVNLFKSLLLTAPDVLRESLRRLSTPRQTAACAACCGSTRVSRWKIGCGGRRYVVSPSGSGYWTRKSAPTNDSYAIWLRPSCRRCWTNPESARSAPPTSSSPGPTPAGAAPKPRSPPSPASARWKPPPAGSPGTGSTPSATAALNRALHTIVNWRMIHGHEPTQHYLTRRRGQQKSDTEIRRCLKRYTARHLFRLMESAAGTASSAVFGEL